MTKNTISTCLPKISLEYTFMQVNFSYHKHLRYR